MEARRILLTCLVFVLWTYTTTGQDFCADKEDGPYCEHCWQPVTCTAGVSTLYQPCRKGTACTADPDASYCLPHTETDCACTGAGDQCDAYNPGYIEHCDASGPFLVETCPTDASTCYNDECGAYPPCNVDEWNLLPDCTGAYFCDLSGVIQGGVICNAGEYVTSDFGCAPAPPPACDGSCTGRCPNPVDCSKFFICEGTTVVSSGACSIGTLFDINANDCLTGDVACTFLDGCNFDVGLDD